jgi:2-phospho-L-lactate guanylyltransferase
MDIWAIIPVKSLQGSKRRLAHMLSAEARAQLIWRFLDNALVVLNQVTAVHTTLVISSDADVLALAQQRGAHVVAEAEPHGLNTAVAEALKFAVARGAEGVLILPADLPFLRVDDVEAMLAVAAAATKGGNERESPPRQPFMAICTDAARNGTNALLLCPPAGFTFHYGPGSFGHHVAEALRCGMLVHEVSAPGLQFDLDTETDWLAFRAKLGALSHTPGD